MKAIITRLVFVFTIAGYGPGYDDVVVHGDLSNNQFVAYYTKYAVVVILAVTLTKYLKKLT